MGTHLSKAWSDPFPSKKPEKSRFNSNNVQNQQPARGSQVNSPTKFAGPDLAGATHPLHSLPTEIRGVAHMQGSGVQIPHLHAMQVVGNSADLPSWGKVDQICDWRGMSMRDDHRPVASQSKKMIAARFKFFSIGNVARRDLFISEMLREACPILPSAPVCSWQPAWCKLWGSTCKSWCPSWAAHSWDGAPCVYVADLLGVLLAPNILQICIKIQSSKLHAGLYLA